MPAAKGSESTPLGPMIIETVEAVELHFNSQGKISLGYNFYPSRSRWILASWLSVLGVPVHYQIINRKIIEESTMSRKEIYRSVSSQKI